MTDAATGARYLGTGFRMILRSPRMLLVGAIPALLSTLLLLAGIVALVLSGGDLITWATPFADGWAQFWRSALRITLLIALAAGAALLGSLTFIALTLLIGGPFYEYIAERAEQHLGKDTGTDGASRMRLLARGAGDAVRLVLLSVVGALVLFVLGFVPVLGQTVVPVLAVLFGAWVICLEMTGLVFQRHGMRIVHRYRMLRGHRRLVLGFGVPTYLLCLVPVVQLLVIPSAVIGGTLLAHRVLDEQRARIEQSTGTGEPAPTQER